MRTLPFKTQETKHSLITVWILNPGNFNFKNMCKMRFYIHLYSCKKLILTKWIPYY